MPQLTEAVFQRAQLTFYNEVMKNPVYCTLFIESVVPVVGDDYQQMIRSQKESYSQAEIKCLYTRDISFRERSRLGLQQSITGIIYIPPAMLVSVFGDWKLDTKKILVRFKDYDADAIYEIPKVEYMEPVFGSCIAVRYFIQATSKHVDVNVLDSAEQLTS